MSGKYVALQICDDEDVETMLESFQQQDQMSVLELYIEKDVVGGSMFHSANSLTSCGNNLSNNEVQPPRNVSRAIYMVMKMMMMIILCLTHTLKSL